VAFDAASPAALALEFILDGTPIAGMGVDLQARACAMTFDADVALAVACLTGAQISPCLDRMIPRPPVSREQTAGMACPALGLRETGVVGTDAGKRDVSELPPVGLKLQVVALEFGVAGGAVFRIMATVAALGTTFGLQRMELQKIVPVIFRNGVPPVIARRQRGVDSAALVAIQAKDLLVAVDAIAPASARRRQAVGLRPGGVVVGGDSLSLMAIIAFGNPHGAIVFVGLLLGDGLRDAYHRYGRDQG